MTMDAMLMAHNEDLVRELSGQMERYAAMATEVEHLRDLVARLMEALRAPIGWPTTEAAMMKHARRAGAALEALTVLEARGVDVLLTATKHTYMMRAGAESATRVVRGATWPDALIALAREVQQ